ncbi:hypothetical protein C3B54_111743 [Pontimonas salivibrio]|uniref:Uncharacterized protein n=1 Tax=Pontimonas salivibrio TaxID=1159327 RepID=A0A2L2BSM6_9MICO|nr:hypothetical protein C3B54_111743 [Pontimonas salivibrio]
MKLQTSRLSGLPVNSSIVDRVDADQPTLFRKNTSVSNATTANTVRIASQAMPALHRWS